MSTVVGIAAGIFLIAAIGCGIGFFCTYRANRRLRESYRHLYDTNVENMKRYQFYLRQAEEEKIKKHKDEVTQWLQLLDPTGKGKMGRS